MSEGHSYGNGVSGFDQTFGLLMRQFVPTLIRIAKLTPGQRVLDIATGTGIAAEAALDAVGPSGHVTAADDTPLMLAEARHRLGASPNVSFAVERAGSLTFPDASFNAVLCSMALMIFPDRGHALAEFHRVPRRGGQLVVSINTRPERSLTGLVRMAVARHVPSMTAAMTHHYSLSDAARLRVLLETAKFQSVAVVMETRSFFFPSPLTPISSRSNRAGDHGGTICHASDRETPHRQTGRSTTAGRCSEGGRLDRSRRGHPLRQREKMTATRTWRNG